MSRSRYFYQHIVDSIGFRLTLFLSCGLGLYLVVAALSIYGLMQQSQGLQELSGRHYQRALIAAELSRDAEVIAAQTFESIISSNRSVSQEGALDEDLVNFYRSARDRLSASNAEEQTYLDEIDLWQQPYFASLEKLAQRMAEEKQLAEQEQALLTELKLLAKKIQAGQPTDGRPLLPLPVRLTAQSLLNYCLTALKAEKNGQLFRLESGARAQLKQLAAYPELQNQLDEMTKRTFSLRKPLILSQRATLASAREARLYAQRLTTSSYNFFQSLKRTALEAAASYQKAARNALLMVGAVSAVFLISVLLMVSYIRRHLVERLNRLSDAMSAHVQGRQQPIPTEGRDEIAVIGQAFEVFVNARYSAEQRLSQAQSETEQANQQLRQLNHKLLVLSETDPLTSVANRRHFDQRLQDYWQIALKLKQPMGLIMCDIDYFKRYNDDQGHQAGDECLKQVARTLNRVAEQHANTLLGRYGGEEFILVQSHANEDDCLQLAEELRLAVAQLELSHGASPLGRVSLSLGCTSMAACQSVSLDQLIHQADSALYAAKQQGRNISCRYSQIAAEPATDS